MRRLVASDGAIRLTHIADNRNKMTDGSGQHKQVPDAVRVFYFVTTVQRVKNDAQGLVEAAGNEPNNARERERSL
jgi:hypothetical protein